MEEYKTAGDQGKFDAVVNAAMHKPYIFRLRVKEEEYNDERRTKVALMRATPVNPAQECKDLLAAIARFDAVQAS